jgi:protein tyrosine phosphatase (PTP) superfamily phosphohydrolase (DUF442 family)
MSAIFNFHKVSGHLACAGQPRESQLPSIADEGYKVIINLALADGKYALNDEAALINGLGITYYHIPVLFDSPQVSELASFVGLMDKHADEKIFVHCAANYRASVFTGLYLLKTGSLNEVEMQDFIEGIWQPDPIWQMFIDESLEWMRGS